jgi:hypothetical protein
MVKGMVLGRDPFLDEPYRFLALGYVEGLGLALL